MNKSYLFLLIVCVIGFTACQPDAVNDANAFHLIPEEVETIFAIRPQVMMEKGDFDSFKEAPIFQDFLKDIKDENQTVASVFEDPKKSGIDLNQPALIAFGMDEGGKRPSFVGCYLHLVDEKKFEAIINSTEAEVLPAAQSFKYFSPEKEAVIGWNEDFAVIAFIEGEQVSPELVTELLNPSKKTISSNANARKWINTDFDMGHWMRGTMLATQFLSEFEGLNEFLVDEEALHNSYVHSFAHFDQGAINANSKFFIESKLTNDLDLLFKDKVKTKFADYFPSEDLLGFMTASFSPKGINQFLIEKYSKGFANQGLQSFNIKMDDIVNALDGDIALANYEGPDKNIRQKLLFAAKIDDNDALENILSQTLEDGLIEKVAEDHYKVIELFSYRKGGQDADKSNNFALGGEQLLIKDNILFLTNEQSFIEAIQNGTTTSDKSLMVEKMVTLSKENIFAAALHIDHFLALFPRSEKEAFQNVESTTLNANRQEAKAQLKFKDQTTNSLKQIIQMMQNAKEASEDQQY